MALAKAARNHGAVICEGVTVRRVFIEGGRARGVGTDEGDITADFVVNCTGVWSREFAGRHGVKLPIQANQHFLRGHRSDRRLAVRPTGASRL